MVVMAMGIPMLFYNVCERRYPLGLFFGELKRKKEFLKEFLR
jgi:hypothetical protein